MTLQPGPSMCMCVYVCVFCIACRVVWPWDVGELLSWRQASFGQPACLRVAYALTWHSGGRGGGRGWRKIRGWLPVRVPAPSPSTLACCLLTLPPRGLLAQDAHLHHHLQPGLGRRERGDAGRRGPEDGAPGADGDVPGHDGSLRLLQLLRPAQEVARESVAFQLPVFNCSLFIFDSLFDSLFFSFYLPPLPLPGRPLPSSSWRGAAAWHGWWATSWWPSPPVAASERRHCWGWTPPSGWAEEERWPGEKNVHFFLSYFFSLVEMRLDGRE